MHLSTGLLLFLGSYWALTLILYAFAPISQLASYGARLLAASATLTLCACYGVAASLVLRIVGYGGMSQWATGACFEWLMKYTTGVEFVVQNEENLQTRPAVFIGNHQTELDVLLLGATFPPYCSVTAKSTLKWVPILGWFMALSKTVFIDRENRANAMAAFDSAAEQMKRERHSAYIFPEGTRSYTALPELLPFKKGAFHLAVQAQVPIVPIVAANYSNVLHFQSKRFKAGKIPVKVLSPISTEGMTAADVNDLTQSTRDLMLKELISITEIARSQATSLPESKAVEANGAAKSSGMDAESPRSRKAR